MKYKKETVEEYERWVMETSNNGPAVFRIRKRTLGKWKLIGVVVKVALGVRKWQKFHLGMRVGRGHDRRFTQGCMGNRKWWKSGDRDVGSCVGLK